MGSLDCGLLNSERDVLLSLVGGLVKKGRLQPLAHERASLTKESGSRKSLAHERARLKKEPGSRKSLHSCTSLSWAKLLSSRLAPPLSSPLSGCPQLHFSGPSVPPSVTRSNQYQRDVFAEREAEASTRARQYMSCPSCQESTAPAEYCLLSTWHVDTAANASFPAIPVRDSLESRHLYSHRHHLTLTSSHTIPPVPSTPPLLHLLWPQDNTPIPQ